MNEALSDAIWNRAADFSGPSEATHRGDAALHRVLVFHGAVMNGGLFEAVQSFAHDDEYPLEDISAAYLLFGAEGVVGAIEAGEQELAELAQLDEESDGDDDAEALEQAQERVNERYSCDDEELEQLFLVVLRSEPELFAPLG